MQTYEIDQMVVYGKNGICRVADIRKEKFDRAGEREYYILEPLHDKKATYYVPLDSEVLVSRMRNTMTKDEIDAILDSANDESIEWIDDKKQRNDAFRAILSSGDQRRMLRLAHCIYNKKTEKEAEGRKLWACDENLLRTLEGIIAEEIGWCLGISQEQVGEYIKNRIGNTISK